MKKTLLLSCLAATFVVAQEKIPNTSVSRVAPHTYAPKQVKVLGDLDDGRPGHSVYTTRPAPYRAFVFSAYGGQKVDITVSSSGRRPFIALADSTLNELATGTNTITFSLPYRGPYIEVWYVVFRDLENKPAHFTVQVKKVQGAPVQVARSDE